ncbi:MAG TPA: peptidase S24 [Lentisphaeria bacterium]|nr:MAG: peptidase S24 [Lentisphaerae bacterium GWF2_50_93]HCE46080.1 peptidase S24 [Lentisphaeria bacterium]
MKTKSTERPELFSGPVAAGFPSPASDYIEGRLDLNEHLVKHPAATFFVRASGDSMTGAGIFPGDILIVDRSLKAADSNIVIASIDGEFIVKRLRVSDGRISLVPENKRYNPIEIAEGSELKIWGVVAYVIHNTITRN